MSKIPKSHPRYESLITREEISKGLKEGLVHETGLIAHGRGEAFDYLIGEKTIPISDEATKVAAAWFLLAKNPVISINGNVAALSAKGCIELANIIPAKIEINLFHRTERRVKKIAERLAKLGAKEIYGLKQNAVIPYLEHDRALCDKDGIYSADVVLVPLEDGDRCEALKKMGKIILTIDLNPLSRTAKAADVTIVDNITRAIPNIKKWVAEFKRKKIDRDELQNIVDSWDNKRNIK
ncbi:MAG TPA: phosphopantothenate/pantothenate synthetase, partial [Thermoplasmatales archaeon]|nr:phosphopantothenate/pantothenate synthetase [Thermoplasmatales archaeon]HEX08502.1 phosphopantothenate/pantothenate synthetase [Thermoplasmatales archaeon]